MRRRRQYLQAAERPAPPKEGTAPAVELDSRTPSSEEQELPQLSKDTKTVQLAIAGAGPAGLAVADRVSQSGTEQWLMMRSLKGCRLVASLQTVCHISQDSLNTPNFFLQACQHYLSLHEQVPRVMPLVLP